MSKQKGNKLLDFLAGKGFYVVLILCVAAIGISGYMLFFGGSEDPHDPNLALVSPANPSPGRPSAAPAVPSPVLPPSSPPPQAVRPSPPSIVQNAPVPEEPIAGVDGIDDEESVEAAAPVPLAPSVPPEEPPKSPASSDAVPDFFMPVNGASLLTHYSESANVFYEYMREWRFHPGIDLETNAGALVQCSADGVVKDIFDNAPRNMGVTIVVEHSGGFETLYSNLTSTMKVTVGQSVEAGETIGAVGETAISEKALPPHLHFEILKDGEPVDPMDYLPN